MKTNKLREVVRMHLDQGHHQVQVRDDCRGGDGGRGRGARRAARVSAGRAEREAVRAPGGDVLGARLPAVVDDEATIRALSDAAVEADVTLNLFLDLDGGMHRTGIAPGDRAVRALSSAVDAAGLRAAGLHIYDGHIHDTDLDDPPESVGRGLRARAGDARRDRGRRPRGPVGRRRRHADVSAPRRARRRRVQSGTTVFWDFGYSTILPDLDFAPAVLLLTRVISRPEANRLCLDLGHKAVASENPHPRVKLFGLEDADGGRPQRGAPGPRNRSRRRFPGGHRSMACRGTCARRWRCTTKRSWSATAGPAERWQIVARARTLTI